MDIMQILSQALIDLSRVEQTAGANDAAYRKQSRIILNSPGVLHALAKARDAPAPVQEPEPAPKRKRPTKAKAD